MIEKFKETYLKIIVKNICYILFFHLLYVVAAIVIYCILDLTNTNLYLCGFLVLLFFRSIVTAMYFIIKRKDFTAPWRYILIASIVYLLIFSLWVCFLSFVLTPGSIGPVPPSKSEEISFLIFITTYCSLFDLLLIIFADVCVSTVLTIKRRKAKKAEAKIPAQENVTSENDFPPEVQADWIYPLIN